MCNCKTMVREWKETIGGKRPASLHAPECEDYKPETFARVDFDGALVVMEIREAAALEGEYAIEQVQMTRDQFERLPEY